VQQSALLASHVAAKAFFGHYAGELFYQTLTRVAASELKPSTAGKYLNRI
jgi:hypothetical protein